MTPPTYPCAPISEVPEGHYSRLCPSHSGQWPPHDENQLADLACRMREELSPDPQEGEVSLVDHVMRSGYVYFGQFIDHDITRDVRLLDEAGCDPEQTLNYRTPRLDLDLLYGKDPSAVPCLYERNGRLKLGRTQPGQGEISTYDDLPRRPDGTAVVVDSRSDENLIIAQTHVLFAKFHNCVLELLAKRKDLSAGPVGASLFEQARRFVTWHYQWIVLRDFLPHVVQNAILQDIERHGLHLFPRAYTPADSPMALPVEFTVAAFRFGHSMIRDCYLFRPHRVLSSAELIRMTKRGGGIYKRLPASYVISWKTFVTGIRNDVNRGEVINTYITPALYALPPQSVQAFRLQLAQVSPEKTIFQDRVIPPLPELTLRRGSRVRLPSGEEFARRFGYTPLPPAKIPARPEDVDFFNQEGFRGRTPLWYYILREAKVEAVLEDETDEVSDIRTIHTIQKLGTVGGRIVAEVLYQLLNADYDSIMHAGKDWRPPAFVFGTSKTPRSLTSLRAIVDFVSAAG